MLVAMRVRARCALPIAHERHWGFALVVEDALHHLDGIGHEQGYVARDVTPEATRAVLDREIPGMGELMRARGREKTPLAALSRQ